MQFANKKDDSDFQIEISEEENDTTKQIFKAILLITKAIKMFKTRF